VLCEVDSYLLLDEGPSDAAAGSQRLRHQIRVVVADLVMGKGVEGQGDLVAEQVVVCVVVAREVARGDNRLGEPSCCGSSRHHQGPEGAEETIGAMWESAICEERCVEGEHPDADCPVPWP
jgi:hypothetical protein